MKKFPKAISAALLVCTAVLVMNNGNASSASPAPSPNPWLSAETALPVGGDNVLLRSFDAAAFLNTDSGRIDVLPPGQKVLDAHTLANPAKLVLLTAGKSGVIEKQVYDSDAKSFAERNIRSNCPNEAKPAGSHRPPNRPNA